MYYSGAPQQGYYGGVPPVYASQQQQQQQYQGTPQYGQYQQQNPPYGQPQQFQQQSQHQYPSQQYPQQGYQQFNPYSQPSMQMYQSQNAEARANEVISKLKYSIEYYKIDLPELFCKFDRSSDSTLDAQEFGELLQKIDPTIQAYEIYSVFTKFDTNRTGSITFSEFCKQLGKYTASCSQVYDPNAIKQNGQNSEQAIEKLKYAITYYKINLRELFAKYDTSRNANLNLHEFGQMLKRMEPNLTNQDIDFAFKKFDTDRSGTITFDEFQTALFSAVQQQQPYYPQQSYPQQGYPTQQGVYPQQYSQYITQQTNYPPQQNGYQYPPAQQQQQYSYPPQQAGYSYPPMQQSGPYYPPR